MGDLFINYPNRVFRKCDQVVFKLFDWLQTACSSERLSFCLHLCSSRCAPGLNSGTPVFPNDIRTSVVR